MHANYLYLAYNFSSTKGPFLLIGMFLTCYRFIFVPMGMLMEHDVHVPLTLFCALTEHMNY